MSYKILFAGESWTSHTIHVKGLDSFTTSVYKEGVQWIRDAMQKAGHKFVYIPGQNVSEGFPFLMEELKEYDAIILSDIGANTFLLPDRTFSQSMPSPNRLDLICEYVREGGSLLMIGGYLTFQGIDAKGRYQGTAVEECLPVNLQVGDDRVEMPQGFQPVVTAPDHEILQGIPAEWPRFLGYNRFTAKPDAQVLMKAGEDPFLVTGRYGKGRTAAFASDCSPHWAPPGFVDWAYYPAFWNQLVSWMAGVRGNSY